MSATITKRQEYELMGLRLLAIQHNAALEEIKAAVMEMRRAEGGMRFWAALPGEYHSSYTGELQGLWQRKGMAPQSTALLRWSLASPEHKLTMAASA